MHPSSSGAFLPVPPRPEPAADPLRDVLREHYLFQIICDHDRGMDNPVCACSRVFLGWHPSVGAAAEAWIDHVLDILAEAER